jgi:UPF0755 protein
MARFFKMLAWALTIVGALAVCGAYVAWTLFEKRIAAPGPASKAKLIFIPKGTGSEGIAQMLERERVAFDAFSVLATLRLKPDSRPLRAGEYEVPARASILDVLEILRSGKEFPRRVAVPEGLTNAQVLVLLKQAEYLEQDALPSLDEGTLLPDTYNYTRGDKASDVVRRMRQAMDAALADAWRQRDPAVPLTDQKALLILASIVEKETGQPDERGLVAGVFANRLKKNMRLQTDPSVIYGVTKGSGPLDRGLTRRDLDTDTPWNTYTRAGLPPTPIANPGRASLLAAAKPAATDALYFVADGTGGHAFAKTLDEHNRNVAKWRRLEQGR